MLFWWLLAKPITELVSGIIRPILIVGIVVFVDLYFQIGLIDYAMFYITQWIEQLVINTVKDSIGLHI